MKANLSLIQRKSIFNSTLWLSGGNEWLVFWWWWRLAHKKDLFVNTLQSIYSKDCRENYRKGEVHRRFFPLKFAKLFKASSLQNMSEHLLMTISLFTILLFAATSQKGLVKKSHILNKDTTESCRFVLSMYDLLVDTRR